MSFFSKIKNFFVNLFQKKPKPVALPAPKPLPPFSKDRKPLETALEITGDFETEGDPWTQVTGNFDGEGASLGILQWNFGQNSIQPLIRKAQLHVLKKYCPKYWKPIWDAANSEGVSGTDDWNLRAMNSELKAYLGSPEFKDIQTEACGAKGEIAKRAAAGFYRRDLTVQEFCFFFDIVVQSGSMKNVTKETLASFVTKHMSLLAAKAYACRWAMESGDSNAEASGRLWLNDQSGNHELLVIGFLRALQSKEQWQGNAFARRGTIAMGYGVVEGERKDYRNFMGLKS